MGVGFRPDGTAFRERARARPEAHLVGAYAAAAVGPGDWSAKEPYGLDEAQRLFLFTRSGTNCGGSDGIQRNIIAERVLGLPREPR